MAYVDEGYYKNKFLGEPVEQSGFPSLCQRAEEIIEEMTMYRVSSDRFAKMSKAMQDKIRQAVCAQMEYLEVNGGFDMDSGSGMQSAALGKFSYTESADATGGTRQSLYAPRAVRILMPTGLLYRGGGGY